MHQCHAHYGNCCRIGKTTPHANKHSRECFYLPDVEHSSSGSTSVFCYWFGSASAHCSQLKRMQRRTQQQHHCAPKHCFILQPCILQIGFLCNLCLISSLVLPKQLFIGSVCVVLDIFCSISASLVLVCVYSSAVSTMVVQCLILVSDASLARHLLNHMCT